MKVILVKGIVIIDDAPYNQNLTKFDKHTHKNMMHQNNDFSLDTAITVYSHSNFQLF